MADEEQLAILGQGVRVWNQWRQEHPEVLHPDLSGLPLTRRVHSAAMLRGANLSGADLARAVLIYADLCDADLSGAILRDAKLYRAALRHADLSGADLTNGNFYEADLTGAILAGAEATEAMLRNAVMREANLFRTNLASATLAGANLESALLIRTNLQAANLTNCYIYGVAAWGLCLDDAIQLGLVITPFGEPLITIDNLEVAQFVYLLLASQKIRDVLDTVAKKAVLLLGRFTERRKPILEAIRDKFRDYGYLPILFDFDPPRSRDLTETVATLAHLSRFIVADLTEPRSIPQELSMVVPNLRSVPVQPIIADTDQAWAMFEHFSAYPWVLPIHKYHAIEDLLANLQDKVIAPAEAKVQELRLRAGSV